MTCHLSFHLPLPPPWLRHWPEGKGMLRNMGRCRPNGLLFTKGLFTQCILFEAKVIKICNKLEDKWLLHHCRLHYAFFLKFRSHSPDLIGARSLFDLFPCIPLVKPARHPQGKQKYAPNSPRIRTCSKPFVKNSSWFWHKVCVYMVRGFFWRKKKIMQGPPRKCWKTHRVNWP